MKVVLSREIWSNALFSAIENAFQAEKFFSFASEEILIQPSLSVCLHLYRALLIHPVCTFFLPRSVSFSHYFARLSSLIPKDVWKSILQRSYTVQSS